MIRFEEITNKNIWKVCMLEPFEEQKDFVAENIQSLAEAYATRNEGSELPRPNASHLAFRAGLLKGPFRARL